MAQPIAEASSRRALSRGDEDTNNAYRHLEDVMRKPP